MKWAGAAVGVGVVLAVALALSLVLGDAVVATEVVAGGTAADALDVEVAGAREVVAPTGGDPEHPASAIPREATATNGRMRFIHRR